MMDLTRSTALEDQPNLGACATLNQVMTQARDWPVMLGWGRAAGQHRDPIG